MLGAAHMTMKNHFDMDELLQHLVSKDGNKGKTRVCELCNVGFMNETKRLTMTQSGLYEQGI